MQVGGVSHGTLALATNGSFSYTPTAGFVGSDSFTYVANDGHGNSNVATVTIRVVVANTPPVAVNDAYETTVGTGLTVGTPGVLGNDTDAQGDALTAVQVGGVSHGTLALATNGSFSYTPTAGFVGSDSFTYMANDGHGNSNVATVTIRVVVANTPPVAVNDAYETIVGTGLTVGTPGVLANDTGGEGSALTAVQVGGVSHGTLALATNGSFSYTPTAGFVGSDSFTYMANGGYGNSNVATVTITVKAAGTFGLDSGDNTYAERAGVLDAMKFQNSAGTGTLTKLEIMVAGTAFSGKVRLGIYADANGMPGALLLDAGEVVVSNGWISASSLSLPVTGGTSYWLAYDLQNRNTISYKGGRPAGSHYWRSAAYGPLPVQFSPSGAGSNNNQYVMRATVVF